MKRSAAPLSELDAAIMNDDYFARTPAWTADTKVDATYYYKDRFSNICYRKERGVPKTFRVSRPSTERGPEWVDGLDGTERLLYRFPEYLAAPTTAPVFITEGEKDCDAVRGIGCVAVTCDGGTAPGVWHDEFSKELAGRDIIILPDNDQPGKWHAERVARSVKRHGAKSVRVLELPELRDDGGDASDWIEACRGEFGYKKGNRKKDGNTSAANIAIKKELMSLADRCVPWKMTIVIAAGKEDRMLADAEEALSIERLPVFDRGGILVTPRVETVKSRRGSTTKVGRAVKLSAVNLAVEFLSPAANWIRYDLKQKKFVPANPPHRTAEALIQRGGSHKLRKLAGVISHPTFRPDGSILTAAGYDPDTQLYLIDPPPMPPISDKPTKKDAEKSLSLLNDLLVKFPFVDDASRSVALSAILSVIARGACTAVPMHVFNAPVAGTGKSVLGDTVAAIAFGQPSPVISAGWNSDELEKRIAAEMIAGQAIVSIDNLNGILRGDALCQMLDRPSVNIRPLGRSESITIENRATVVANGNNLQLSGDIVRRAISCMMDAGMEDPNFRTFNFHPVTRVLEDRGKYIAAALTVVRAYFVAGMPDRLPKLGSFEEWSDLIRSALVWLGKADPCATIEAARDNDPERSNFVSVMIALRDDVGFEKPLSTGELIGEAIGSASGLFDGTVKLEAMRLAKPALRAALMVIAGDRGSISNLRLGHWLARHHGRIIDGCRLEGANDKIANQKRWKIVQVGKP
ncbi:hypothetical protein NKJ87_06355 [Mesorhizobium sp. M0027]|uniref:hypothetical protein n=1 Tax=unclassified Mesorhizobium TaxID=325217 RepID=UPI0012EC87B3|nr:hypothetical protein [Mesorhizobium sp. LSHC420B00]